MSSSPNPRVLADEEFVSVQPALIRALDGKVMDALVIQYLYWWQRISQNELDGHHWVYNTYEEWSARLGISPDQFKRTILRLEDQGLVVSCKPNAGQWKHRKWYRVDVDHEFWETLKLVTTEGENPVVTDRAISPERSGGIAQSRSGDIAQSRSGDIAQSSYIQRGHSERTSLPTEVTTSGHQKQEEPQGQEPGTIQGDERVTGIRPDCHTDPVLSSPSEDGTLTPAPQVVRKGPDDVPNPEYVRLCHLLADLIEGHEVKRPNPDQKAWHKAIRLLVESDGYTVAQVETIIRWAQADSFWCSNVLSAPKLRLSFGGLKMRRNEEIAKKKTKPQSTMDMLNEREKALA